MMRAAAAGVNITPPVGLELSGWCFGPSVGIHDELYAKALILESGGETVGLITADLIGFGTRYADRIRAGAADRLGTSPRNVMVSCSHTHSGPGTMKLREWGALDECYVETVIKKILGAVAMAAGSLREARIGTGIGEVPGVAVNRRAEKPRAAGDAEEAGGASGAIGAAAAGPVDTSLGVIRLDDAAAEPGGMMAVLMNYSCHPVAAHDWENMISADYPGYAAGVIEAVKGPGTTALFTTGAAGDINPVAFHHIRYAEKYGHMVGAEALKTAEATETAGEVEIAAASKVVALPVEPLPAEKELERVMAEQRRQVVALEKEAEPAREPLSAARIRLEWAEDALRCVRSGEAAGSMDMEMQVIRLGDTALVCLPAELFVEIGLNIKAASPFPHTFIVELANGSISYIPTDAELERGGYEVDLASKVYGLYTLKPGVQALVETAARELLASVR